MVCRSSPHLHRNAYATVCEAESWSALQVGVHMQRPMRQAGGDVFGGRRLLARGGGIDSAGSMWGLVGQGRKPEAQQQRPVQPVRPPLVRPEGELWHYGSGGPLEDQLGKQAAQAPSTARVSPGWLSVRALTGAA